MKLQLSNRYIGILLSILITMAIAFVLVSSPTGCSNICIVENQIECWVAKTLLALPLLVVGLLTIALVPCPYSEDAEEVKP